MSGKLRCVFIALSLPALCLAGPIYVDTDADGHTSFQDTRTPDATVLDLPPAQTYRPSSTAIRIAPPEDVSQALTTYTLAILEPAMDAYFTQDVSQIPVHIQATPALSDGDQFAYHLDDQLLTTTQDTSLMLAAQARGAHTLSVHVVDEQGAPVGQETASVTFYQYRHFIRAP